MLDRITPLVLTYNEEANIRRLLESLSWARRVVVVDSGSTDATRAIVAEFPNTNCVIRAFDDHTEQWNFGLAETGIESEWVLALDADYGLPPAFMDELRLLDPPADMAGLRASFRYCIDGVALRGGLYPPVVVLFRRDRARYIPDGHTQRVEIDGRIRSFSNSLLHDDRKPLEHWLWAQGRYMRLEATKLLSTPIAELGLADKIRRLLVVAPILVFFYCLLVKGNILDGRRGLLYALQRAIAEAILSMMLLRSLTDRTARK
jgi:glycosyltransferase involved in cell wall biosynthesis